MLNDDGLDALQQANPRNAPTFDTSVAAVTSHTRQALAAAALGTSAGAVPSALGSVGAKRNRRGRRMLGALIAALVGAGTMMVAVLLLANGTTSTSRSSGSQTGAPAGTRWPRPSLGGGSATIATAPAVSNAGPPGAVPPTSDTRAPTVASPVATALAVPVRSPGSAGSAASARTTLTTLPRSAAAPTATPTTASAPPASVAPTCDVSAFVPGPPPRQSVNVQDTGIGLASITNVSITNGTVSVPKFAAGTTSPVIVVATKTDSAQPTVWSFDATDVAGHTTHCV